MIFDKIENTHRYQGIHDSLNTALKFLDSGSFADLTAGTYEVQGEEVYGIVKVCRTRSLSEPENCLEAHRKYIDVHYVIEGTEEIGVTSLKDQVPVKAYDPVDDYALYKCPFDVMKLEAGNFAIFFPDDVHMPEITRGAISDLKKIVLKVRL